MISSCSMNASPKNIYHAKVVAWAIVGPSVQPTGNTVHRVDGREVGPAAGLAICESTDSQGFYLFYCDSKWEEFADTWHESLDDAKSQAEFEYKGICTEWQTNVE